MKTALSPLSLVSADDQQIIRLVTKERISILASFGIARSCSARLLQILCLAVLGLLNLFAHGQDRRLSARSMLAKLLNFFTPVELHGRIRTDKPLFVFFNHPSIGEIPRILQLILRTGQDCAFPVSLRWFEIVAPCYERLTSLGIKLMPVVTPHLQRDFLQLENHDPAIVQAFQHLKSVLDRHYLSVCQETCQTGGIIPIALSAGREPTVFASVAAANGQAKLTPTASLLVKKLANCSGDYQLMALAIRPPREGAGLMLFRKYKFYVQGFYSKALVSRIYPNLRKIDYILAKDISQVLPKNLCYPKSR